MKIKKNTVIAIMIAFCFIATLFMVIPIRSQSAGQYDPWLDINDDGRISMDEIVASTTAFGATGDPTKDVNVTNWPTTYEWQYITTINFSAGGYSYNGPPINIYCGGYSKMVIAMTPLNISNWNQNYSITIILESLYWGSPVGGQYMNENHYPSGIQNFTVTVSTDIPAQPPWYFPQSNPALIDVKGPYCNPLWGSVSNNAPSGWSVTFNIYVYLRNE